MKGIYFTDTHIMGRNPGSRVDDYPRALYRKFLEIEQVIKKEKPDFVVHGGDFFHTPTVADSIKNRYLRILRRIKKVVKHVFIVPGNHDLFGYSMDTIDQTAIGVFESAGVVRLLIRGNSRTITCADGTVLTLHGREYDKDIDDNVFDYDVNSDTTSDFNFLFSHGMLLQKPFHPDVKFTLTQDVHSSADLILNGHYHPGMELHEVNGTLFGNPGSTGRDEGSKDSMKRIPQYALITGDAKGFDVEYIEYQVAKKGTEVFDRSTLVERKQHERYLDSFEQTIEDAMTFDAYDPKDVLSQLLKGGAIEKKVFDDTFDAVVDAEKVYGQAGISGYVEKQRAIGIKYVELENFQSHKKTRVEFNEKGLNAITGASDSGKSAIIRGLRWVFYNEPKGADFIRHGESRATVTVGFTDGSSITRSRTNSSAGEYIVSDTSGKATEFKGFGSNLPIDIANTHQMPKVELSTGNERPINFSYQLDGHFLLSESPATRAATIGRLTGVHIVDSAIKEKYKEIRRVSTDISGGQKRIDEIDEHLQTFTDIDDLEDRIKQAKGLIITAETVEKEIEELTGLVSLYNTETQAAINIEQQLKQYEGLAAIEKLMPQAELLVQEVTELVALRIEAKNRKAEVNELTMDLTSYEELPLAKEKIELAEELLAEHAELNTIYKEYHRADKTMNDLSDDLSAYEGLKKMPNLDDLEDLIQEYRELQAAAKVLRDIDAEIADIENGIVANQEDQQQYQQQLTELFEKVGNKCPTCMQNVADTSHILEHVS